MSKPCYVQVSRVLASAIIYVLPGEEMQPKAKPVVNMHKAIVDHVTCKANITQILYVAEAREHGRLGYEQNDRVEMISTLL